MTKLLQSFLEDLLKLSFSCSYSWYLKQNLVIYFHLNCPLGFWHDSFNINYLIRLCMGYK